MRSKKQAMLATHHYFTLQGKDLEVSDEPSWEISLMQHTDRICIASTLHLTIQKQESNTGFSSEDNDIFSVISITFGLIFLEISQRSPCVTFTFAN
jgi:hypothetical protein